MNFLFIPSLTIYYSKENSTLSSWYSLIRTMSLNIQQLQDAREKYPFKTQIINELNIDIAIVKMCIYEVVPH